MSALDEGLRELAQLAAARGCPLEVMVDAIGRVTIRECRPTRPAPPLRAHLTVTDGPLPSVALERWRPR